jgi:hypothetical protein
VAGATVDFEPALAGDQENGFDRRKVERFLREARRSRGVGRFDLRLEPRPTGRKHAFLLARGDSRQIESGRSMDSRVFCYD